MANAPIYEFRAYSASSTFDGTDASGNGNTASLVGSTLPSLVTSPWTGFGQAVSFDGVNRGLNTGGIITPNISGTSSTTPFCLEAKFVRTRLNVSEFITGWGVVQATGSGVQPGVDIGISGVDNKVSATMFASGGSVLGTASSNSAVAVGSHDAAVSWDGTTLRLFIDGVLQTTTAAVASWGTTINQPLCIGKLSNGYDSGDPSSPYAFQGTIDEVRLSKVVRYTATYTPSSTPFTTDANTLGLWHLDSNQTYSVLPDWNSCSFQDTFSDVGFGQIAYPQNGNNLSLLVDQAEIGVIADGSEVLRFTVEDIQGQDNADGGFTKQYSGRSLLAWLERIKVYPSAWGTGLTPGVGQFANSTDGLVHAAVPSGTAFTNATPGTIFRTLIGAGQTRGCIPNLDVSTFTGATDSNGAAWVKPLPGGGFGTTQITIGYATGTSVLQALQDQVSQGNVEAAMVGRSLRLYNPGTLGSHHSDAYVVRLGQNVVESSTHRASRDLGTVVLVGGDNNAVAEIIDTASVATYGRRETFVTHGGVGGAGGGVGTLLTLGAADVAQTNHVKAEFTTGLSFDGSTPQAYGTPTVNTTSTLDSSASGANGTLIGSVLPTYTASPWTGFGQALVFDGVNRGSNSQGVNCGTAVKLTSGSDFTLEARVRTGATIPGAMAIAGRYSNNGVAGGAQPIIYTDGTHFFGIFRDVSGVTQAYAGTTVLAPNTSYTVAFLRGSGANRLLINGVQEAGGTSATGPEAGDTTTRFLIGRDDDATQSTNGGLPWAGTIDEVRLSNADRYGGAYTPATTPFTTDAATLGLWHLEPVQILGTGFTTGDWLWRDVSGSLAEVRVKQISIQVDSNGKTTGGVTLNDLLSEADVALARRVQGITIGATGTGPLPTTPVSDTMPPSAPTGVSAISNAYTDPNTGTTLAQVTAFWSPPTTNVDTTALTDLTGYLVEWHYVGDTSTTQLLSAADAHMESVGSWTGTNATVPLSSAQKYDGTQSLALTNNTGTSDSLATTGFYNVTSNLFYSAAIWVRAATVLRQTQITIQWFDSSNNPLTTNACPLTNDSTGAWTLLQINALAPALAAKAKIQVRAVAPSLAEVHYFDNATLYQDTWNPVGFIPSASKDGSGVGGRASFSPVQTGKQIEVHVAAADGSGNVSAFATSSIITTATDVTAPNQPSTPNAFVAIEYARVTWDGRDINGLPMPIDFARCEIHASSVNSAFTPSTTPGTFNGTTQTLIDVFTSATGGTALLSGLTLGTAYYIKLVAVDLSGNRSVASAASSAVTPTGINTGDLVDSLITNAKLGSGAVSASKLTVSALGSNAVLNGTFEDFTGTQVSNWTYDASTTGSTPANRATTVNSAGPLSGAASLTHTITGTADGTATMSDPIPVAANDAWLIGADIRTSGANAANANLYMAVFFGTSAAMTLATGLITTTPICQRCTVTSGPANLLTSNDSTFEAGIGTWVASGSVLSGLTTSNTVNHGGSFSLKVTKTGNSGVSALACGVPGLNGSYAVTEGGSYVLNGWILCDTANHGETPTPAISWYDANGLLISTVSGTAVALTSASTWYALPTFGAQAPTGARFAQPTVQFAAGNTGTVNFYLDTVTFTTAQGAPSTPAGGNLSTPGIANIASAWTPDMSLGSPVSLSGQVIVPNDSTVRYMRIALYAWNGKAGSGAHQVTWDNVMAQQLQGQASMVNASILSAQIVSLQADKITAGQVNADIVVGARIKTANTGSRVEMNNTQGIIAFSGTTPVFQADLSGNVTMVGTVQSSALAGNGSTSGWRLDTVNGLRFWNNSSTTPTLQFDMSGNGYITGALTTQSAAPYVSVFTNSGNNFVQFRSGDINEGTQRPFIAGQVGNPNSSTAQHQNFWYSGQMNGQRYANVTMLGANANNTAQATFQIGFFSTGGASGSFPLTLTDGGNSFFTSSQQVSIQGNNGIALSGSATTFAATSGCIDLFSTVQLHNNTIYIHGTSDANHTLVYSAGLDGPQLSGYSSARLLANNNSYYVQVQNTAVSAYVGVGGSATGGTAVPAGGWCGATYNGSNRWTAEWTGSVFHNIIDASSVKTFVIDHPVKKDRYLRYAALEGPHDDVWCRGEGRLKDQTAVVALPEHFRAITDETTAMVEVIEISEDSCPNGCHVEQGDLKAHQKHMQAAHFTTGLPDGHPDKVHAHEAPAHRHATPTNLPPTLTASRVKDGKFTVRMCHGHTHGCAAFWWRVTATRSDHEAFDVEPRKSDYVLHGDGPYTYLSPKAVPQK